MFATSLETRLLRLVQNTQVGVLRVSRSPKSSSEPSALIIPPARVPGGIGDDAMLSSIIDHLLSHNFKRIGIVTFDTQHKWRTQEFVTDVVGAVARADKFRLVNMLNRPCVLCWGRCAGWILF
jgi:hypothetical protein